MNDSVKVAKLAGMPAGDFRAHELDAGVRFVELEACCARDWETQYLVKTRRQDSPHQGAANHESRFFWLASGSFNSSSAR